MLLFFAVLMVFEAVPDAVQLGRRIFRPKRPRKAPQGLDLGPGDGDILARREMEEEPATVWGRVAKAKIEIFTLTVDAATVQDFVRVQRSANYAPELEFTTCYD